MTGGLGRGVFGGDPVEDFSAVAAPKKTPRELELEVGGCSEGGEDVAMAKALGGLTVTWAFGLGGTRAVLRRRPDGAALGPGDEVASRDARAGDEGSRGLGLEGLLRRLRLCAEGGMGASRLGECEMGASAKRRRVL